jgi:hypothetical protein
VQRDLKRRLRELRRCAGQTCFAAPRLRLFLRSDGRPISRCLRGDLRVRVGGSERDDIMSADVLVGRRRVGRALTPPVVEDIPLRKLRSRGRFRLRVRTETIDGRRLTLDRVLRACR